MNPSSNGSGTAICPGDEIHFEGQRRVLIVPGEYAARALQVDGPVPMYGTHRYFLAMRILNALFPDEVRQTARLPDGQPLYASPAGAELFCVYNVEVRAGRVVCRPGSKLALDWARATGERPRVDRISLQPLIGKVLRVRVATVIEDHDGDRQPPQLWYSRVVKILGPHAEEGLSKAP